jgi:UDP:flavonoid glycosyltransferase YjiC (YdhE family)
VDGKLFQLNVIQGKANNFSFLHEDFSLLRAVICRPGIGIISTCIQNKIPLLAIDDLSNDEISHNSYLIEEIGLGKRIFYSDSHLNDTFDEIQNALRDDLFLASCKAKMQLMKTGGSTQAAEFILGSLYQ